MIMTREADYAVRCVLEVARQGHLSVTQVAAQEEISPAFLSKIVRSLARAGVLSTRRGVGGGMTLARPPEQITMLEVIEAAGGPLHLGECLLDPPTCLRAPACPIHPHLCEAEQKLREELSVSIADLVTERAALDQVAVVAFAGP
jgi:Rrf2 family protein